MCTGRSAGDSDVCRGTFDKLWSRTRMRLVQTHFAGAATPLPSTVGIMLFHSRVKAMLTNRPARSQMLPTSRRNCSIRGRVASPAESYMLARPPPAGNGVPAGAGGGSQPPY